MLGVAYRGGAYRGWQSQPGGATVQDRLESALARFADRPVGALRTVCAGRTDAGVHALNQVVHLDPEVVRSDASWVRGTNRYLPADIAIQWCRTVDRDAGPPDGFHARFSAIGRRYLYVLRESPVRPALESGLVGWSCRPLSLAPMQAAAAMLVGEHDFSAYRSAECQAASPVKRLHSIEIERRGACWRFGFDASAFLHHMVRNLMGALTMVGAGLREPAWPAEVLAGKDRRRAAPTFPAQGLYFVGPYYDHSHDLPERTAAHDWLL